MKSERSTQHGGRFFGFHQSLVKLATRLAGHQILEDTNCWEVRVRAGGDVVSCSHKADISDAPEDDRSFAILRRFFRVGFVQFTIGMLKRSEVLEDQFEGFGSVKFTRHNQHGIIGLVMLAVECSEIGDGNSFNIAAIADR